MAFILVKAQVNPLAVMYDMTHAPGFPVSAKDTVFWSSEIKTPRWIYIHITDKTAAEVKSYCDTWDRVVNFSVQNHIPATDTYTIHAEVDPSLVSQVTSKNALTQEIIENFLNRWNVDSGTIATAPNSVTFDAGIYQALISIGFWNVRANQMSWFSVNHDNYDSGTGLHTITVDYTIFYTQERNDSRYTLPPYDSMPSEQVDAIVLERVKDRLKSPILEKLGSLDAITNIDDVNKKFTFVADRNDVRTAFLADVKERTDKPVYRKKWIFTQAAMDAAMITVDNDYGDPRNNKLGVFSCTAVEALSTYLIDRIATE